MIAIPAWVEKAIKDINTVANGRDYDFGRIMGSTWALVYAGIAIYIAYKLPPAQAFPFSDFGVGGGALAAGIGAMLNLKAKTEPNGQHNEGEQK